MYDLTHTYFEGVAAGIDHAKRGRSKEKRNDCPLVSLGLVLDVSGFPKRGRMFAANVSEATTLQKMLAGLAALPGARGWSRATVVMDAGIATEANLVWLKLRPPLCGRKPQAGAAVRSRSGNRGANRGATGVPGATGARPGQR